jgi:hypothetical protein
MKSLIKPLLVAVLAAALSMLLVRLLPPVLSVVMQWLPPSWSGSWLFWANGVIAGVLVGLLAARLLTERKYYVLPLLTLVFSLMVLGGWAQNRCNADQLAAIDTLSRQMDSHSNIGNPYAVVPPPVKVDLSNAPGVTQDEQGYGYNYTCISPDRAADYVLSLASDIAVCLLGVLLGLLVSPRRRTAR